jgi:Tfp pilus assembly protein PilX
MTRLRDEAGITVPLTVIVMTLATLLAGIAFVASQSTTGAADEERRGKRALAAAEAGLQEAAYRLTALRPDPTKCLSGSSPYTASLGTPTGVPPGECVAVTGEAAPGDTYSYHATPALSTGATCAGLTTTADSLSTDHCITSTGTARGISRRVQARIRVERNSLFGSMGVVGLTSVTMMNSDKIYANIGSNGQVLGSNSVEVFGNIQVGPDAPNPVINGSNPPVVRRDTEWDLPPVDFEESFLNNNNSNLTSWGTSRYMASTRRVALDNSVTYTIPGGTYNLCDFYADNSVNLRIQAGHKVRLFIDSPLRPGSNCPTKTGRFCLDNSVLFNKDFSPTDVNRLEVYVYGNPPEGVTAPDGMELGWCSEGYPGLPFDGTNIPSLPAHSNVVLNNSVEFFGSIYAPTSRVILTNSIKYTGAVAANVVDMGNSIEFRFPTGGLNQDPAVHGVRRLAWVECRPAPTTATDYESGCPA